jgi:hypothetical protein
MPRDQRRASKIVSEFRAQIMQARDSRRASVELAAVSGEPPCNLRQSLRTASRGLRSFARPRLPKNCAQESSDARARPQTQSKWQLQRSISVMEGSLQASGDDWTAPTMQRHISDPLDEVTSRQTLEVAPTPQQAGWSSPLEPLEALLEKRCTTRVDPRLQGSAFSSSMPALRRIVESRSPAPLQRQALSLIDVRKNVLTSPGGNARAIESNGARARPLTQAKRQLRRSISTAEGSLQACHDCFEEEGSEGRTPLVERVMDKADRVKLAMQRKLDRERRIIDTAAKHGARDDDSSDASVIARSRGGTAARRPSQTAPGDTDGPARMATSGRGGWARARTVGGTVSAISGVQPLDSRNGSVDIFDGLKSVDAHVGTGPARLASISLSRSGHDLEPTRTHSRVANSRLQPDVDLSAESFDAGMEMSDLHLESLKTALSASHLFLFPERNTPAYRSHRQFLARATPSRVSEAWEAEES